METQLLLGDCLEQLKNIKDNTIDSIVTDPPYGLSFMGKDWDKVKATKETKSQIVKGLGAGMKMTSHADNVEFGKWVAEWSAECLRVLKPGGYMLAFGGSRMYHRLACGVEDAGFEIRDQIMWVYGSGFPKSHNISKQLDKRGGNNHLVSEVSQKLKEARESRAISKGEADKLFCDSTTNYMWFEGRKDGVRLPDDASFEKICNEWSELKPYQDKIKSANREVIGQYEGDVGGLGGERLGNKGGDITISATDVAKDWEGWGTALKPAHEPIVMARKPFSGTVADNVLEWGTGGINIDGCRVGNEPIKVAGHPYESFNRETKDEEGQERNLQNNKDEYREGRFPANIIFDEEAGKILDEQSGERKGFASQNCNNQKLYGGNSLNKSATTRDGFKDGYNDTGGASRFFYCPKASKKDRDEGVEYVGQIVKGRDEGQDAVSNPFKLRPAIGATYAGNQTTSKIGANPDKPTQPRANIHPTVKPTDLMAYLIRLVTPKGGVVLDPFTGSGSTGKAAVREGMNFIGIEREEEYFEIAKQRIEWEVSKKPNNKFWD